MPNPRYALASSPHSRTGALKSHEDQKLKIVDFNVHVVHLLFFLFSLGLKSLFAWLEFVVATKINMAERTMRIARVYFLAHTFPRRASISAAADLA